MTADEIKAIRERAKRACAGLDFGGPANLAGQPIEEDIPALCDEVERLQKQLQSIEDYAAQVVDDYPHIEGGVGASLRHLRDMAAQS